MAWLLGVAEHASGSGSQRRGAFQRWEGAPSYVGFEDHIKELFRPSWLFLREKGEVRVLVVKIRPPRAGAFPVVVFPKDSASHGVWEGARLLEPL